MGAYLSLALIWGCSFLLIEVGLRAFAPTQVVLARVGFGALTLVVLHVVRRDSLRVPSTVLRQLVLLALVMTALPFTLIAFAQTRLTSVLAGLLNGTVPLWAVLFVGLAIPASRPSSRQVLGVVVGFAGLAILVGIWDVEGIDLIGTAAMLGATACYGLGSTYMQLRLAGSGVPGPTLSAWMLIIATAMLAPFLTVGGAPTGDLAVPLLALLILGSLGSGLAYVFFWRVVRGAGATVATSVTYVIPVVSTTLGVLVLSEPLTWFEVVGGAVILGGVYLVQTRPRSRRADVTAVDQKT